MPAPKRARPSQKFAPEAHTRKRQKTETAAPARKVKLSDLSWNSVELPDRLDDYEGFFGLEEIEDVEVVKDEKTGVMSFETRRADVVRKEGESGVGGAEETEAEGADDEEWEGFSDDNSDVEDDAVTEKDNAENAAKKAAKKDKLKAKKEKAKEKKAASKKRKLEQTEEDGDQEDSAEESLDIQDKTQKPDKKDKKDKKQKPATPTLSANTFDILMDAPMDSDDEGPISVDVSAWKSLGLSQDTLDAISSLKFSEPTPIQSSSIPEILAGHDVVGKASTGSGKTLAFGIPILESFLKLNEDAKKLPLALIISPTRELAHQISAHLTALCSGGDFTAPSIATITGGLSVQKQRRQLETANIIVGTPGRLWEVISSGHGLLAALKKIRFLVVDEADRLLSEGHFKEMKEILNVVEQEEMFEAEDGDGEAAEKEDVPKEEVKRQTLVFSATFHKGLQQKLAGKSKGELMAKQESMDYLLKKLRFAEEKPKFVDANPTTQMASNLKEGLVECAGTEKDLYLYSLLMFHPKQRALVFTNSIAAVRRITPFLQNLGLPALPLHSQMVQKARLRSIERFAERPGSILVATDVAARGLDIKNVELILHYHLPRTADTYVHRSGRTARGSTSGTSILICAPEEVAGVRRLVGKLHERATRKQKTTHFIRTLDIDRRIVSRLKPRATLAKKLADAVIAKEKKHSENDFLREAAEDLGVEFDSDTFDAEEVKGKRGRGSDRKKKEKEARQMSKGELQALRAELKALLSERINTGVSARYLTNGGVDVQALLTGVGNQEFLGKVEGLEF